MLPVLITLLYSFVVTLFGISLLRLLGARGTGRHGLMVFSASGFMMGTAVMAVLWLFIALAGQLSDTLIRAGLSVLFLAGLIMGRSWLADLAKGVTDWVRSLPGAGAVVLVSIAVITALMMLLSLAAWFRPPIGDAEAFYMVYPKVIAASGKLEILSGYEGFSQIGLLGELHFAVLFALSGQHAAKLFVIFIILSAMATLYGMMKYVGVDRRARLFGILVLLSSTAFVNHASDGKVDLFAAAFGLSAFYHALFIKSPGETRNAVILAGLFSGFAIVSKFSYIPSFIPALFVLVYLRFRETGLEMSESFKGAVRLFVVMSLLMGLTMLPHFIKNGILFNAPFAPFIGGAAWTSQTWFSALDTAWIILTYPFALVFGRYPMQGGNLSFLLLVLLPLVVFLLRRGALQKSIASQLAVAALVGTLFWILARPSVLAPRYILAVLLLYIPVVALAAGWLFNNENRPRILGSMVAVCMLVALVFTYFSYRHLPAYIYYSYAGKTKTCEMASLYCPPLSLLNKQAGEGERVFFASYYSYWLRSDLLLCRSRKDDSDAVTRSGNNPDELWRRGFRYIVLDKSAYKNFHSLVENARMSEKFSIEPVIKSTVVDIYRLSASPGNDVEQKINCVKSGENRWVLEAR